MICIYCFHKKTTVINSRTQQKSPVVWRRRTCQICRKTFTSYERPSTDGIKIVSDTASVQSFSLGKLILSIAASFSHSEHEAEFGSLHLAETVELQILKTGSHELASSEVATLTYQTLKRYDELAAVQYAARHNLIATVRRRGRPSITSLD